ncbi:hypothetical protein FF100_24480 [Methylobacterium terricola]|uniref:Uncharacterized protein n=1 Tax=Methylobacterium terricola TaxID=2583531 RepID=A0A5C4LC16_9HYPH|nr:hypothetical protein [Methylobacterium terricola]TNC10069.1 hypothetical protein FF100_24480 [Methylobacterium terricola]
MWSETRLDPSGKSCTLLYDSGAGAPRELRIARQATIGFLGLQFATIRHVPWKTLRAAPKG